MPARTFRWPLLLGSGGFAVPGGLAPVGVENQLDLHRGYP